LSLFISPPRFPFTFKIEFNVNEYRETKGLYVLGSLEEILTLLEDNQVTLQTMLGSRYIRTIQAVSCKLFVRASDG
jgi:hypothetical protein